MKTIAVATDWLNHTSCKEREEMGDKAWGPVLFMAQALKGF